MQRVAVSLRHLPGLRSNINPWLVSNHLQFIKQLSTYNQNDYETYVHKKLDEALKPDILSVNDISGGCGSMFAINIVSDRFKGLTTIKQHRLVNEILKDDINQWHGLQLKTSAKKD